MTELSAPPAGGPAEQLRAAVREQAAREYVADWWWTCGQHGDPVTSAQVRHDLAVDEQAGGAR